MKDSLDNLNSNLFRTSVENDPHRVHNIFSKPCSVKSTLWSTNKYRPLKCLTTRMKTSFIPDALLPGIRFYLHTKETLPF